MPSRQSNSNDGESRSLQRCIYTGNKDETGLQRHKSTTGSKAGQSVIPPGSRVLPAPYWNPPQFPVGSTGVIAALENDGHNLACIGIELNDKNPAGRKEDPVKDDWRYIPGHSTLTIGGGKVMKVTEEITIISGQSTVTISPEGVVKIETTRLVIEAEQTTISGSLEVGGYVQVDGTFNADGLSTVGGEEIALFGAVDDNGHKIVDSNQ